MNTGWMPRACKREAGRTCWRGLLNALALLAGLAASIALPSPAIAASPLVDALNALRTAGCNGQAGVPAPLKEDAQLAEAAHQFGLGAPLREALAKSGYRVMRSANIRVRGDAATQSIIDAVAKTSCTYLMDAGYTQIGVYQQDRETWILLATPFSPPAPDSAAAVAKRMLALVNQARGQARMCGDKPFAAVGRVKLNATLSSVALGHASDMAKQNYFAHEGLDGSTPAARTTRSGYKWRLVGENIASGMTTPEGAVEGWLKSPPHCANLMTAQFTEMGVAFAVNKASDAGIYWAQEFATPLQ